VSDSYQANFVPDGRPFRHRAMPQIRLFRLEMPMRISAGTDVVRPLIIGAAVYLVMRFLVPLSLGEEQRSPIGGGVAFVVAIVLGLDRVTRA